MNMKRRVSSNGISVSGVTIDENTSFSMNTLGSLSPSIISSAAMDAVGTASTSNNNHAGSLSGKQLEPAETKLRSLHKREHRHHHRHYHRMPVANKKYLRHSLGDVKVRREKCSNEVAYEKIKSELNEDQVQNDEYVEVRKKNENESNVKEIGKKEASLIENNNESTDNDYILNERSNIDILDVDSSKLEEASMSRIEGKDDEEKREVEDEDGNADKEDDEEVEENEEDDDQDDEYDVDDVDDDDDEYDEEENEDNQDDNYAEEQEQDLAELDRIKQKWHHTGTGSFNVAKKANNSHKKNEADNLSDCDLEDECEEDNVSSAKLSEYDNNNITKENDKKIQLISDRRAKIDSNQRKRKINND
jgi:hypothetical protein